MPGYGLAAKPANFTQLLKALDVGAVPGAIVFFMPRIVARTPLLQCRASNHKL
jgi:hypothetical protein